MNESPTRTKLMTANTLHQNVDIHRTTYCL